MLNKTFFLQDGTEIFLHWEHGTYAVYDAWDWEHIEEPKPLFVGHYDRAVEFIKTLDWASVENLF